MGAANFGDFLPAKWWNHPNYHEGLNAGRLARLLDSDASFDEGFILMESDLRGDGAQVLREHADRLRSVPVLGIINCGLGPTGAETLAEMQLGAAHTVDLSYNKFGLEWCKRLADSPLLENLERLGFGGNVLAPGEFTIMGSITDALCPGKACRGLKSLNLRSSYLDGSNTWYLFDALHLPNLVDLDISDNVGLGGGGLVPWRTTEMRLKRLLASECSLSDDQVKILAESDASEELLWLDLSHNPIGTAGIEALVSSPNLTKLQRLDLRGITFSPDAKQMLSAWEERGAEVRT